MHFQVLGLMTTPGMGKHAADIGLTAYVVGIKLSVKWKQTQQKKNACKCIRFYCMQKQKKTLQSQ